MTRPTLFTFCGAMMLAVAASAPASGQGNVAETNSRATIQAAREAEGRKPGKGAHVAMSLGDGRTIESKKPGSNKLKSRQSVQKEDKVRAGDALIHRWQSGPRGRRLKSK